MATGKQKRQAHFQKIIDAHKAEEETWPELKLVHWKILRGETNLRETMELLGGDKESIDNTMNLLKKHDTEDASKAFQISLTFKSSSYQNLVRMREIDPSKMWHISSCGYGGDDVKIVDLAFQEPKMFRYNR